MMRMALFIRLALVILIAGLASLAAGANGLAASSGPARSLPAAPQVPLLCAQSVTHHYCDIRLVLLIDDTGSMRSNDPTFMRDQAAKNLVDILYQEYYQPARD